jgi:hypothetical protein
MKIIVKEKNEMKKLYDMTIVLVLILAISGAAHSITSSEITQAQAIARVKTVLRNNAGRCRITSTVGVSAVRVKAGWRVTARVKMSASGRSRTETAVWIVSAANGVTAQNQLTAELAIGCP